MHSLVAWSGPARGYQPLSPTHGRPSLKFHTSPQCSCSKITFVPFQIYFNRFDWILALGKCTGRDHAQRVLSRADLVERYLRSKMTELSHFDERSGVVECKTPWGSWYQTVAEVHIQVKLPPGTRGKEVSVRVTPTSITCHVRGNEIFKVFDYLSCGYWF